MYVSILEYALVRIGLGAVCLVVRVAALLVPGATWACGALMRLAVKRLTRELAGAVGRLRGHWQLAARSTRELRSVAGPNKR